MVHFASWADLPGHIAYIIIAISYIVTSIFWLRVAAVVGLSFEITYFTISGAGLYTSIMWDSIFILINLVQLGRLMADRMSLKLTSDQKAILGSLMRELDKAQIAQLMRTGSWRTLPPGTELTREGEQVADLSFICRGFTEVRVRDQVVARVGAGNFIGDISFSIGRPATATVVADEEVYVLAFDQAQLKKLCAKDEQIASAIYRRIGGALAGKMHASSQAAPRSPATPDAAG